MELAVFVLRIGIRFGRRLRDSNHGLHISCVIEENAIAFANRLKMFLRDGISNTGPCSSPIPLQILETVVGRFFFDEPVHASDLKPSPLEAGIKILFHTLLKLAFLLI